MRILCSLMLVACALPGCDEKSLPTAPSDLATGMVVYEDANFLGESAHITEDVRDLKDFKGPCHHIETIGYGDGTSSSSTVYEWNDCISSVRVAPGWRATLYRDDDFKGKQLQVITDIANLQLAAGDCDHDGFNDCTTSIQLFRP